MHLKIHLKRCIFSAVFYSTIRLASHSCLGCHSSSTETTPAALMMTMGDDIEMTLYTYTMCALLIHIHIRLHLPPLLEAA